VTEERRKNPRVVADASVRLETPTTATRGHLCDICRDAALVEVQVPLALGEIVTLFVELPGTGNGELRVSGKVIRLAPGEMGHAAAILFSDLPAAAVARIEFFLALQRGLDR